MKTLIEYLEEKKIFERDYTDSTRKLSSIISKEMIEDLMGLKEFQNVKKINILRYPLYTTTSGEEYNEIKDFLGGTVEVNAVQSFKVKDDFEFSEIVDLYDVFLVQNICTEIKLVDDFGVWQLPTIYHPATFAPKRNIQINYSLENISERKGISQAEAKEEAKQIILKKVAELIDSEEANVSIPKELLIRCTPRSIKIKTK